ncbi:TIGR01212 family radical SAM protein [Niveibacterium microcysteis]|uniref:TIGR01212 family radical SAM protein n=1 Tax=Niveibacterium microcysteis TaxID=2811415 RepID=A0ABX7MAW2_9RHOO|nr:TIGR01212 family radical SAM protein [Niveibacterium microcysteis]QSI78879.1 TIGR01212 family radical SAM protein [Niveibacterium microcysteis]
MDAPDNASPFGKRRYNAYNDWIARTHGGRIQKVSVSAGFTCPNRDGTVGTGGCSFCNNAGFTPGYLDARADIHAQIDTGIGFLSRRYPNTRRYLAYFQTYSNTYGELARLRACYEAALAHPAISGLAIGTRPDCLSDAVLDYLAGLAEQTQIELEIGIESTSDAALTRVNRGHDFACSVDAIQRAAARGLFITGHLIFGLPGESREDMLTGASRLSALPLHAIKFHQLQLVRGTALAREWQSDPAKVPLFGEDEYLALLADFVERLAPRILIQRLGSEVPPRLKLAPHWNLRLSELAPRLEALLTERGTHQGFRYHEM